VVVVEENKGATRIIGSRSAPYINSLARTGLNLTNMHAETHPSEPNYLALFSGSTQGVRDDSCPHTYQRNNLAAQLLSHHLSFAGYSESLPSTGWSGCYANPYARKHNPWVNFSNVPAAANKPLSAMPTDFSKLPRVSFVVPNLRDDMHDGTIAQGDAWLRSHLGKYATWARTHHSLLIVTWDEDEGTTDNHVATIAVGAGVAAGTWAYRANHYTLLAVLERTFGLPLVGGAAHAGKLPPLV
jgi:acid phosphatase